MIIDTDRWNNIPSIVNLCREEGNMYVAVSNPCFEFWLLLHICRISDLSSSDKENILSNSKVSNSKRFIDRILGEILEDGYNKRNPRITRFMKGIHQAIAESKNLNIPAEDYPSGLGSDVYKVVETLIR